ncbi:unnamed protein product [Linum tenue]|uniref:BAT2 N-terminal domain-containing protein n=1 Tax=Linum tenue TaxID=586396 RepID=A0AAV0QT78_9ROSI|nr:unnamed protein product [Linum tenue]
MASSALTGERRWSARRGGMTVLGKVAVPKPINLPSQRLENHGLDPNVEIVPKGTHSWGSRSSSSSSNAWGSSTLSPSDGGTGSPSYVSGRPSSGGGTRPSTAGSDRGHEPLANAWSSSSRPSSASGPLTSSQTAITASRPRSADTRPGSSQLSRFAEPLSDNSVAWGASGTTEKLGVAPSKKDSFSLTSGDFPTLGSEKETSTKDTDIAEHVFPHDSPSGGEPVKESTADGVAVDSGSADLKSDNTNAWRRESSFYQREGVRPNVEQWHADPQPYPNSTIPQHFDAWHGPPLNNHPGGGVWYRGPPGGPPFAPPVGPGGFPMEAFPYYRPQIPPGAMANAQAVPPQPSAGPRGHPKHGDVFGPPIHDAYIRPGMPIRPGFYPAPVPYEGYYGPPMAYNNNANERDIPYMGMPVGPGAYNRYPNQNAHESGNSHGRSSGFGSNNGKGFVSEKVESGHHPRDTQGPYKVLLKQREGWDGKAGEQKWDDNRAANVVHPGNGDHPRKSALDNGWRTDQVKRNDGMETKRVISGRDSGIVDHKAGASSARPIGTENGVTLNPSDTGLDQISEHGEHGASFPKSVSCSRDPSLMKKIEGLNAKARAADGRQDAKSVSSRDEQKNKQKMDSIRSNHHPVNEDVSGFVPPEKPASDASVTTSSFDDQSSGTGKSLGLTVASGGTDITRRSTQGMHIKTDHRGKGRSSTQDADSWRRRTQVTELNDGISSVHVSSAVRSHDCTSVEATEKSVSHQGNDRESMLQASEPSDTQAQRAMMRELARQRLKQREKEEEERTREQKAKALAKLEELNRRMPGGEGSSQKLEILSSTTLPNEQEELLNSAQSPVVVTSTGNSVSVSNSVALAPTNEGITNRVEISAPSSNEVLPQESKKNSSEAPLVMHDPSKSRRQDSGAESVINNARQEYDGSGASKQKRMNYRQKQNSYSEKTSGEKVSLTTAESSKSHSTDAMPNPSVPGESNAHEISSNSEASVPSVPVSPNATAESSTAHPRRKIRSTRNKQKLQDAAPPTAVAPSSALSIDTTTVLEASNDRVKPKTPESSAAPSSVQLVPDRKGGNSQQHMEQQHPTSPNEDIHIKPSSNQWKSQPFRRMSRNQQANNKMTDSKFHGSSDTVVWAPVRSHNIKSEDGAEEGDKKSAASLPPVKSGDLQLQNVTTKNKRAEMERYVPKPVAKEMAQQGNANHSVASPVVVQMPALETIVGSVSIPLGPESSQTTVTLQFGSIAEATRNGQGTRQIKPVTVQGSSWHQCSSAESQTSTSNLSFQKSTESQQQPHNRSDATSSVKRQPSEPIDEWTDGWTMPEEPDAPIPVSSFKDQTATARGRRQPQKGLNRVGHNLDSVETKVSMDSEKAHTRSWQPKSQSTSATGQRATKPNNNDDQNVVSAEASSWSNKRGSSSTDVGVFVPPPKDKEVAAGRANEVHPSDQEGGRRERKVTSHKGHNNSSSPVEPAASDQNYSSSGYRRGGGNQFNRDHHQESRGEWSGTARDNNRQHNVPTANKERAMKQSSHYEYQPVGQQIKSKGNNFEPSSKDVSHASRPRFRERVPNHARRGGGDFHGRQGGSFRVLETSDE